MIGNLHKEMGRDEFILGSTLRSIRSITIIGGNEAKRIIGSEKFPFAVIAIDKDKYSLVSDVNVSPTDMCYTFVGSFCLVGDKYIACNTDNHIVILSPDLQE